MVDGGKFVSKNTSQFINISSTIFIIFTIYSIFVTQNFNTKLLVTIILL
jgi:hypothetical protein